MSRLADGAFLERLIACPVEDAACCMGRLMTKKSDFKSDYDQCNTFLLSAYFCVMGQSSFDNRLRKSIEDVLTELLKAQNQYAPSNIIPFRGKHRGIR